MTADQCGGDDKSHSSKFADGTAKACEIQRYSRQKTARQRIKNSKHCILRRTRTKIPNACWGHPKPRNDRTAVIKKSAYAEIKRMETLL